MFSNEIVTYYDRFAGVNSLNLSTNFGNAPINAVALVIKRMTIQWTGNNASTGTFVVGTQNSINAGTLTSSNIYLTPSITGVGGGTFYDYQEKGPSLTKLPITGGTAITLYIWDLGAQIIVDQSKVAVVGIQFTYCSASNYSYAIDIKSVNSTVLSSNFVPINIAQYNGVTASTLDMNIKAVNGTNLSSNFLPT